MDYAAGTNAIACGEKTLNRSIAINTKNQKLESIIKILKKHLHHSYNINSNNSLCRPCGILC